jgi:hypothetical protein
MSLVWDSPQKPKREHFYAVSVRWVDTFIGLYLAHSPYLYTIELGAPIEAKNYDLSYRFVPITWVSSWFRHSNPTRWIAFPRLLK